MSNQRLALLQKQSDLESNHCATCKRKSSNSNRYCVDSCETGKELRSIGNQLLGLSNRKKEMKLGMAMNIGNCAKLKYLVETYPFLKQKDMANIIGVAASQISSSLKSTNYKNSKPDMSIQEHVQNYMKKYYPDKMADEVIVTKSDEQQIIKSTSEHVSIEKYQAMKNSWKRLAEEKDIKIKELELQLKTAPKLSNLNFNEAEELREKLEKELEEAVEHNKLQKAQYATLLEQYETVAAAYEDAKKEIVTLKNQIETINTNHKSCKCFELKEENAVLKGQIARLESENRELLLTIKSVQSTEKLASMLLVVKIQECLQQ